MCLVSSRVSGQLGKSVEWPLHRAHRYCTRPAYAKGGPGLRSLRNEGGIGCEVDQGEVISVFTANRTAFVEKVVTCCDQTSTDCFVSELVKVQVGCTILSKSRLSLKSANSIFVLSCGRSDSLSILKFHHLTFKLIRLYIQIEDSVWNIGPSPVMCPI